MMYRDVNFQQVQSRYMKPVIAALNDLGIPANLRGYEYLKTALCLVLGSRSILFGSMMEIYRVVAKWHGVSRSAVERCIRHAIEVMFDRLDVDTQKKYFGNCVLYDEGRVRNSEFLGIVAEKIRVDMGEYDCSGG